MSVGLSVENVIFARGLRRLDGIHENAAYVFVSLSVVKAVF